MRDFCTFDKSLTTDRIDYTAEAKLIQERAPLSELSMIHLGAIVYLLAPVAKPE